jgi:lauroyl/myristoyl acyltransferase
VTGASGAHAGDAGEAAGDRGAGRRASLLLAAANLVGRLPEAPLLAAADASGELWYRLAGAKRAQARANLQRVCEGLAATGRGPASARRAATDPDALERLVRASFRHAARYYLEVARTGAYDLETATARLVVENPDEVDEALAGGRPIIIVGMHFGSIELPVVYISSRVGHEVTAPMEMVDDPALRQWFVTSRSRVGVRIIPLANARRPLVEALRRGESIGLVSDRDILGSGLPTPFFGHPAPMPAGPAMLAIETGAPIYAGSACRTKDGRYRGRLVRVPTSQDGSRRERIVAITTAMAETFETLLADAPEQWWGAFHPIWPDLAVRDGGGVAGPGGPSDPGDGTRP